MSFGVWHLLSNRWNSAVTEYALSTAKACELLGFQNTFSPLAASPAEERARGSGLVTVPVNRFTLMELPWLRRTAEQVKPRVVFCYGGPETFLSRFLWRGDSPKIVRFRGQEFVQDSFASAAKLRISHAHVELLITPSEKTASQLRVLNMPLPVRALVLGCDAQKYVYRTNEVWHKHPSVLIFGRFDPVKGHARFFRLFAEMLTQWPKDRKKPFLHVVGEPANLSLTHLERAGVEAGLVVGESLRLTAERVGDVASLLGQASVGVIPSLGSELICRVAEEFLLCGTPVFVSGAGSLNEVLSFPEAGSSYGGLSDNDASHVLRDLLFSAILEGEDARQKRSEKARSYFSIESMADSLKPLLHEIIA